MRGRVAALKEANNEGAPKRLRQPGSADWMGGCYGRNGIAGRSNDRAPRSGKCCIGSLRRRRQAHPDSVAVAGLIWSPV